MNVTLKLPDELVRQARHLAIDENTSLSALVGALLDDKIRRKNSKRGESLDLAQSLLLPEEPEWFKQTGFPVIDRNVPSRSTPFEFEDDKEK